MKRIVFFFAFALIGSTALAQDAKYFQNEEGVAIAGYDLVAYQSMNKAVEGEQKFAVEHDGATFYFANASNMKTFQADPETYLPVAGGYCAYATAKGNPTVPVDPTTFKIVDGDTYLFYVGPDGNGGNVNTLTLWNQEDEAENIQAIEKAAMMSH